MENNSVFDNFLPELTSLIVNILPLKDVAHFSQVNKKIHHVVNQTQIADVFVLTPIGNEEEKFSCKSSYKEISKILNKCKQTSDLLKKINTEKNMKEKMHTEFSLEISKLNQSLIREFKKAELNRRSWLVFTLLLNSFNVVYGALSYSGYEDKLLPTIRDKNFFIQWYVTFLVCAITHYLYLPIHNYLSWEESMSNYRNHINNKIQEKRQTLQINSDQITKLTNSYWSILHDSFNDILIGEKFSDIPFLYCEQKESVNDFREEIATYKSTFFNENNIKIDLLRNYNKQTLSIYGIPTFSG